MAAIGNWLNRQQRREASRHVGRQTVSLLTHVLTATLILHLAIDCFAFSVAIDAGKWRRFLMVQGAEIPLLILVTWLVWRGWRERI